MWSSLVFVYVSLVTHCLSIGLFVQQQQNDPATQGTYSVQKPEKSFQCTCTDGVNTKTIPFSEQDDKLGFITSYFAPSQSIASAVKPYLQKTYEQNLPGSYAPYYGRETVPLPNIGSIANNLQFFKPGKQNPAFGFGIAPGFGFTQGIPGFDCMNSAFGKSLNLGTSPCQTGLSNVTPNIKTRPQFGFTGMVGATQIPGMPYGSFPQQLQLQPPQIQFGSEMQLPYSTPQAYIQPGKMVLGFPGFNVNANPLNPYADLNTNVNINPNGMGGLAQPTKPTPVPYINFKSNLPGVHADSDASSEAKSSDNLKSNNENGVLESPEVNSTNSQSGGTEAPQ